VLRGVRRHLAAGPEGGTEPGALPPGTTIRVEKTVADPLPGESQGRAWLDEVSPDYLTLHFRVARAGHKAAAPDTFVPAVAQPGVPARAPTPAPGSVPTPAVVVETAAERSSAVAAQVGA
jgi:hypothetical protein